MHSCIPSPQPEFQLQCSSTNYESFKEKNWKKKEVAMEIVKGPKVYSRINVENFAIKVGKR